MDLILKKIKDDAAIIPLHSLLAACGKSMHEKLGLSHWHPFMDINTFHETIKGKDVYGVFQNEIPVATFNISTKPRDYYFDELWSNPREKAIYVGQLATDQSLQGGGIGKWCMKQITIIAQEKDSKAIRFDALMAHPWLKTFYEKLGYTTRGIVKPKQWDLVCYEKIIY